VEPWGPPDAEEGDTDFEKTSFDTWRRYDIQSMLGASLAGQKKYADAEALLTEFRSTFW
jgi:hypothetical protein